MPFVTWSYRDKYLRRLTFRWSDKKGCFVFKLISRQRSKMRPEEYDDFKGRTGLLGKIWWRDRSPVFANDTARAGIGKDNPTMDTLRFMLSECKSDEDRARIFALMI
jgi:hypothetical protein